MGDYSVPCCLSGLPIAAGQRATAIAVRKIYWEQTHEVCAPIALPIEGKMGYYGSIEEDLSVFKKHEAVLAAPSERTKPSGIYVLYAHPELYTKAAELYTKAMPVKTTLFEELKLELWEYYEKGGKNTVTAEYYSDSSSLNRPWISRFKHFNLGVSHPDTFRCELHEVLDDFCIRDNVKNHEAEINEFQKLIAVFCSQRLIGRKIDVHQHYCFEQYPTFKWEEKWTHAVWKLAKESKK